MTLRKDTTDGDFDYEQDFTLLYKSWCPAILTENLFQDNKKDCEFLMSEKGRQAITQIHINAIKAIVK
jgi:N-acetylmuramoyl-L-alanine amidase